MAAVRRGTVDKHFATWDADTGQICLPGGADVLIHLAGRSVATRWSAKAKHEIWESRVPATEKLCRFLAAMPSSQRPSLMVSTSAVGIYGDRGDELLTEDSTLAPPKRSFLADVCIGWEAATVAAREAGIRVIHPRLGVVLSREGGALAKLLTPTKLGLGGPVGTGLQWLPWISLTDAVGMLVCLAEGTETTSEVVNLVAPNPVRQHEFMRTLGRLLHRPTIFPLPSLVVKLVFGEMGREILLSSQRAIPSHLPRGFLFTHETLEDALRSELTKA